MPDNRRRASCLIAIAWTCLATALSGRSTADEFDRLGDVDLGKDSLQKHARKLDGLDFQAFGTLPAVLKDARSSLLVVVTDQGNIARFIASPGYRKVNGDADKLVPTLVLDRYETRNPVNRAAPAARGKDVWLFGGFGYDLDAGQVAPLDVDLGADLQFTAQGPDGGRLTTVGKAELYVVESLPPTPRGDDAARPSAGRVVRPTDYNGTYRLAANGAWSGLLKLQVDRMGEVTGGYQSDMGGESHPVSGKTTTGAGGEHGVTFTIRFPRTKQDYDGWLWGEGKNVIAGSVVMLDQTSSFIAIREGTAASLAAVGLKIAEPTSPQPAGRTLTLDATGERFLLDADPAPRPIAELAERLKNDPDVSILLKAPASTSFKRVHQLLELIEDLGIRSVRLTPIE